MIEGGGSKNYEKTKTLMHSDPRTWRLLSKKLSDTIARHLAAQVEAGAQAVMVFDSWGGVLADGAFQEFSLAYTRRVVAALKREHDGRRVPVDVPRRHCRGAFPCLIEARAEGESGDAETMTDGTPTGTPPALSVNLG